MLTLRTPARHLGHPLVSLFSSGGNSQSDFVSNKYGIEGDLRFRGSRIDIDSISSRMRETEAGVNGQWELQKHTLGNLLRRHSYLDLSIQRRNNRDACIVSYCDGQRVLDPCFIASERDIDSQGDL